MRNEAARASNKVAEQISAPAAIRCIVLFNFIYLFSVVDFHEERILDSLARIFSRRSSFAEDHEFRFPGRIRLTGVTSSGKHKYSGSQLGLLPAFTLLSNDWLCGDLYLDTAARQLRVLTGFHDAFVICRQNSGAFSKSPQDQSPSQIPNHIPCAQNHHSRGKQELGLQLDLREQGDFHAPCFAKF